MAEAVYIVDHEGKKIVTQDGDTIITDGEIGAEPYQSRISTIPTTPTIFGSGLGRGRIIQCGSQLRSTIQRPIRR